MMHKSRQSSPVWYRYVFTFTAITISNFVAASLSKLLLISMVHYFNLTNGHALSTPLVVPIRSWHRDSKSTVPDNNLPPQFSDLAGFFFLFFSHAVKSSSSLTSSSLLTAFTAVLSAGVGAFLGASARLGAADEIVDVTAALSRLCLAAAACATANESLLGCLLGLGLLVDPSGALTGGWVVDIWLSRF